MYRLFIAGAKLEGLCTRYQQLTKLVIPTTWTNCRKGFLYTVVMSSLNTGLSEY